MGTPKGTALLCLLGAVALPAGCTKEVRIQYDNATSEDVRAELEPQSVLPDQSVIVPADMADTPVMKVRIKTEELPMNFHLRAGHFEPKAFTIHEKTPDRLFVHITPNGIIGPVDEDAEIHMKHDAEVKEVPIRRETVIE